MLKKIYFCGSIRGGRSDYQIYQQLIKFLSQYAEVLTEHVGDQNVAADHGLSDQEIHDRDMNWLRESDLLIAEVTQASLGVGYEIGRALELGKPVICLYRKEEGKRLSAMIAGAEEITICYYKEVEEAMEFLAGTLG